MSDDEKVTKRAASEVARVFDDAPFVAALGLGLESIGPGACMTVLALEGRHLQQDGFVHAGRNHRMGSTEVASRTVNGPGRGRSRPRRSCGDARCRGSGSPAR
jgi:hypothetical protein